MGRQAKLREAIRAWLQLIMDKHNVSQRQLALRSEVSPSAVNRAMDEEGSFLMSTTTMTKIAAAFGEKPPTALAEPAPSAPGFSESDLVAFVGAPPAFPRETATNHGRWRIASEALDLEGFRPGDVVEFDMGLKPEPGDIVVAQVYNVQRGTADTVLRVFQPPYLLVRSSDRQIDARPLYVDGERVVVMGTFVRMVRERAA